MWKKNVEESTYKNIISCSPTAGFTLYKMFNEIQA